MDRHVLDIVLRVVTEVNDSIRKHGDWSDYTELQMDDAVFGELTELGEADARCDITGRHGKVREAVQVIATLVKSIKQWESRMILFCDDGHEWFGECLPAVCPRCHQPAIGARNKP